MKILSVSYLCLLLLSCNISANKKSLVKGIEQTPKLTKEQLSNADSLDIKFQIRGFCYAYSSSKNKEKSGGEAHSDNLPKKVGSKFSKSGFYLLIDDKDLIILDSTLLGCKLYLVNSSNSLVTFKAQDSRLDIIPEALNKKGEWKPIGYNPSSWCGNSYHTIKLDKKEYWEFEIPIFKGPYKTKMRYTLMLTDSSSISSNEIDTYLNYEQFDSESKQGHTPGNIMDPYGE